MDRWMLATRRSLWIAVACGLALTCARGEAQVSLPVPQAPLPGLGDVVPPLTSVTSGSTASVLREARRLHVLERARAHRDALDLNRDGDLVVRGELLAQPSDEAALGRILEAGFRVGRRQEVAGLGLLIVVLEPPVSLDLGRALKRLRTLDPDGRFDYHHVFLGGGQTGDAAAPVPEPRATAGVGPARDGGGSRRVRVGLIDSGVAAGHPRLPAARISSTGCSDGPVVPHAHGTAVASVLLATVRDALAGSDATIELVAVDVFCDEPAGGSVMRVVEALGALARERVAVVNVSLVGPRNVLFERAVAAMVSRGHVIVAAVGNDGPAAPPLYPAAYPGVVGVTAVDRGRRVIVEACRGAAVDFAALGADVDAAAVPEGETRVRGTSFAAPVVAGILASRLFEPFPTDAAAVVAELATLAVDLGRRGRDPVYGHGLIGSGGPLRSAQSSPAAD